MAKEILSRAHDFVVEKRILQDNLPLAEDSLGQYKIDLAKLVAERPLLSAEQEQILAQKMEYGKLASAILQLNNTNNITIPIRIKGEARILGETASNFIDRLGISEKVELLTQEEKEEPNKKDADTAIRNVAHALKAKGEIHWSVSFAEQLQRLKQESRLILQHSKV